MKGVTTCQGNERPMSASPAGWAPAGAARRRIVMPASKSIDEGPAAEHQGDPPGGTDGTKRAGTRVQRGGSHRGPSLVWSQVGSLMRRLSNRCDDLPGDQHDQAPLAPDYP